MIHRFKELAFVGVDIHKEEHTVCVTNCFAQSLGVFTVKNRPNRIEELLNEIDKTTKSHNLEPLFGLEDVMDLRQNLARLLIAGGYQLKDEIETFNLMKI